ncbi:hypothetical protein J7I98_38870 [Streptomyces sp. ISL-98]|uniref:hypothetical protein n=1 Tax=Streptomyces sp. ISL-98 TaxID=2819192 RepID=UPI001BE9A46B|nr:hypothetical protein [Streptomyces sp. ISL-98]MBT2511643.1 hypothetical protein [Streptomyces sp. ISL-98]
MERAEDGHDDEPTEPTTEATPTSDPARPARDEILASSTPSLTESASSRGAGRSDALAEAARRAGAAHAGSLADAARRAAATAPQPKVGNALAEIVRQAGATHSSGLAQTAARLSSRQSGPLAADIARTIGASGYAAEIARQANAISSLMEIASRAGASGRAGLMAEVAQQLETSRGKVLSELAARVRPAVAGGAFTVAAAARDYATWASRAQSAFETLGSERSQRLGLAAGGLAAAAANLRGLDELTPGLGRLAQFSATARLAEVATGPGALASWRISLEANSRLEAALKNVAVPSSALTELARLAGTQVRLTDWMVERDRGRRLLGELSGRPVLRWANSLAQSLEFPEEPGLWASAVTGRTNLALVSTDALVAEDTDGDFTEAAELVEEEILAPWQAARFDAFADLYAVLGSFDKHVPELLDGAWDDIRRAGPAAAVKAANCVIEAVDRTFRAAAPDEKVRAWHEAEKRPKQEWEGETRPPHALRAKYLARNLAGDRKLVEAQSDAFAAMHRRIRGTLQGIKHASQGDITKVRSLLMAAECLLVSLLLEESEPGE